MMIRNTQTLAAAAVVALAAAAASAGPIAAGDLVVYRVGDGSAALTNASTAVFVDEYTPAGALVQSIAMPTSGTGALTASGSATSEGLLTVSPTGQYAAFAGYNLAPGTASVNGTASATVNRSVGVLTLSSGTTAFTRFSDFADGNNPRSAVTTNGTDLYFAGAAGGVRYGTATDPVAATTSTQLSTTVTNIRQTNVFGGQLYVSTSSGSAVRIGTVGTGTPTTTGQTITNLPGFVTSGSPYQFFLADLSSAVVGVDTLYVADDGTGQGIQKYSLVGGNWTFNNLITSTTLTAIRGLTAAVSGSTVTLYGTSNGNAIVSLTDTSGYNANDNGTLASIVTAGTNTAFRGIGVTTPEPTSLALLGVAGMLAGRRRR